MKGKSRFTGAEANEIIALIRKKLVSDRNEQKKIRDKIRNLGFYASDFGIGGGYTELDFLRVITITNDDVNFRKNSINNLGSDILPSKDSKLGKREASDEAYVLNLCDEVIGMTALRQHRFAFLRGDSGVTLPVDAFYPKLNLVIEYRELQHTEDVKFFNKRNTVSGVNRGEQRKLYDQRRREVLPENHITLIEFDYTEFEHKRSKRLIRNIALDIVIIKEKLSKFIKS